MTELYKCKKQLTVDEYDDDGFYTENYKTVEVDEIYEKIEVDRLFVAEKPAIRLENNEGDWLELMPDKVSEYFDKIEKGE